jgi:DNA mismatch repair protein MutL
LAHAVAQAYHTFLPIGRHPIAVLNITLDPAEVDVNVHPTKAEVKFREPGALFSAVQRPVRAALTDDAPLIRAAHLPGPSPADWSPTGHHDGHGSDRATAHSGPAWSQFGLEVQRSLPAAPLFDLEEPAEMPPLRVIGQIRQTYIITEGPDGLYLIDQHAAHERILYEKLMAQKERAAVVTQRLLNPLLLELIPAQIAVLTAEMETLLHLGFEIEPFGGNSFRLLAVPEMLAGQNLLEIFADILSDMADGAVPLARQTHDRVAIIVCKRASIKGGQTLSQTEMEALIRQLEQSQNPRTCPHGRPTMIHFSAYQLAKEFGRH